MAKLFKVIVLTQVIHQVVAETPEEAQGKVTLEEGQTIASVTENGDVTI